MALAPNWEDHDASANPIINYFAGRKQTEIILKKQEYSIAETCKYCKVCQNCKKVNIYRD